MNLKSNTINATETGIANNTLSRNKMSIFLIHLLYLIVGVLATLYIGINIYPRLIMTDREYLGFRSFLLFIAICSSYIMVYFSKQNGFQRSGAKWLVSILFMITLLYVFIGSIGKGTEAFFFGGIWFLLVLPFYTIIPFILRGINTVFLRRFKERSKKILILLNILAGAILVISIYNFIFSNIISVDNMQRTEANCNRLLEKHQKSLYNTFPLEGLMKCGELYISLKDYQNYIKFFIPPLHFSFDSIGGFFDHGLSNIDKKNYEETSYKCLNPIGTRNNIKSIQIDELTNEEMECIEKNLTNFAKKFFATNKERLKIQ